MDRRLTPSSIYELVAEVGFKKYFHLGGFDATKELIDLCPINENSCVIDIGCASGKTACCLARRYGCNVMGVDILAGMIERAKERARAEWVTGRVEFKVGDAQKLPLEDDLFDIVLGEFITGLVADKDGAVSEYVRVAKPGATTGLSEATWLKAPPPRDIIGFLRNLGSIRQFSSPLLKMKRNGQTRRFIYFIPQAEDGYPLVLLHGAGLTSTVWFANISELSAHHRVYAVDVIADAGKSVADRLLMKRADYAHWLREVFDGLNIERGYLLGHCYGGWLTLNMALAYPERLRKIVLLAPAASFRPLSFMTKLILHLA